jgi:hypothetical protein
MNASAQYQTRELSHDTWQDFEKLFSRGNGWDHCWCVAFQRLDPTSRKTHRNRAEAAVSNRGAKKDLVDRGRAHGILVDADGDPVGWCHYGSSDELNGRRRAESATDDDAVANVSTSGIVSMFEKEGFKAVAVCGSISARVKTAGAQGCHVLMRKVV